MSIDLHVHSTISDGSMDPVELVMLASRKNLKAIAITDHDSMDGCFAAHAAGQMVGVEVVPGVELSVTHGNKNLHLLGYYCRPEEPELQQGLLRLQESRLERNKCILQKLAANGIHLSSRELLNIAGPGLCGRPHIAKLLVKKGIVSSMEEAFNTYLASHGRAYCSRFMFTAPQAIDILKQAGGFAVLAHPGQLSTNPAIIEDLIAELIDHGLDGVELYYPTHSRQFRKRLSAFAERHQLLITGGSDYHGSIRPGTTLAGGKNVQVPFAALTAMKNRLKKVSQPDHRCG
jgi:predicted metal-dependent phosphoesterase TrpH